jgi:phosphoglycolate phosphatase
MRFKAVCFDLDGTLLDTLDDLAYCANQILSERGLPTHHVDAFRCFVGDGVKKLMTRALPENVRNETLIEECRKDFEVMYRKCWNRHTTPYQGISELLTALAIHNLKIFSTFFNQSFISNIFRQGTCHQLFHSITYKVPERINVVCW